MLGTKRVIKEIQKKNFPVFLRDSIFGLLDKKNNPEKPICNFSFFFINPFSADVRKKARNVFDLLTHYT